MTDVYPELPLRNCRSGYQNPFCPPCAMKNILAAVLVLQMGLTSAPGMARTIDVTDFGVQPNSRRNAVGGVQKALEACRGAEDAVLVFPKGRYDFWPQQSQDLRYPDRALQGPDHRLLGQ